MMKRSASTTDDCEPAPTAADAPDDAAGATVDKAFAPLDAASAAADAVGVVGPPLAAAFGERLSFFADVGDAAVDGVRDFEVADADDGLEASGVVGGVLVPALPLAAAVGVDVAATFVVVVGVFSRCCEPGDRTTLSMAAAAVESTIFFSSKKQI
jgi:hypothetical protein